jgi:hypothetical protein
MKKNKQMEALKQTQKKYATRTLTLAIVIALFLILIGQKPVAKGLILGTVFSVLNFILMGKTIILKFGKSKRKTFSISMGSIIFRYLLLAIPLITALKFEQFNLMAAVLGIFMIQLVILTEHLLTFIPSLRKKQI